MQVNFVRNIEMSVQGIRKQNFIIQCKVDNVCYVIANFKFLIPNQLPCEKCICLILYKNYHNKRRG